VHKDEGRLGRDLRQMTRGKPTCGVFFYACRKYCRDVCFKLHFL